ncbi:MAG TPA: LLM class flavin-dependent oxidoreductase [Actinomycetota bacterium]|nr:LLM class flavin-dependent oxidoreductase [Actinomycetota bacterium]
MQLSYGPWGASLDEVVAASKKAEDAGFSRVWFAELHRSAFVPAAAVATATTRIGVGTGIALAFVRSPMTTALEAMDTDELAGGRFVLGIGSGVQRLNESWHNVRFGKAVGHTRETVAIIRRFIAESHRGGSIEVDGEYERMRLRGYQRPFPPQREQIPVYLAAVGDAMTRLAGEIGDGWLGHELGSPRYLASAILPNLQAGLSRAGRDRRSLDVVASACCAIDGDGRLAKRWMAGLVAFYATVRTYGEFFAFHGFAAEAAAVQERFRAGDEAGMVEAVPDEMVDAFALAGTPDEVRAKLKEYDGIADGIKLSPPTHLVPAEVTRHCQATILEQLAP